MFWSNTLSTTGEKHLFQTDQNAILKILEGIKQNGLKNPTILAISKKTERAYIYISRKSLYGCLVKQQYLLSTIDGEVLFLER